MNFSLIVPAAAHRENYKELIPKVFRLNEKGVAFCIEAILKLNLASFSAIYITILREHDLKFGIASMLKMQMDRLGLLNGKVVVLDQPTSSQADTIYQTICSQHISGPIFIKDADSGFEVDIEPINGVVVYPIEKLNVMNPQHKSYVAVDDMLYITNIIEKRVIDHYFSAGGYCFDSAMSYCQYYERYRKEKNLFLSHIVYAMLLDNYIFRPFLADSYQDFELELL